MNINQKFNDSCLKLGVPQELLNCLNIAELLSTESKKKEIKTVNDGYAGTVDISYRLDKYCIDFMFDQPQEWLKTMTLVNEVHDDSFCFFNVSFDDDFNFLSILLPYCFYAKDVDDDIFNDFIVFFSFNDVGVLIKVEFYEFREGVEILKLVKSDPTGMSISDELLLIEFIRYKYTPSIIDIIPEFYIPSAYDFNSETFKQRINLSRMIII